MLYNIGIMDVPGDGNIKSPDNKIYKTWCSIFVRCYSPVSLKNRPTYELTEVCDEWKLYSNFKKWYISNYIEGYFLDKDIIDGTSHIYSPYTCSFVPNIINCCILDGNSKNSNLPIGVHYRPKGKDMVNEFSNPYQARLWKYKKRVSLGCYPTPYDAHKAWQFGKKEYLIELINDYSDKVTPEVVVGLQRRIDLLTDDIKKSRITNSISKI